MILRRRTKRRIEERELREAKLRTSASKARAQREYRTSVQRLADSQNVAASLARHNAELFRRPLQSTSNGRRV